MVGLVNGEEIKTSLPARGGWIEILINDEGFISVESLPARGGWIEIIHTTITL